MHRAHAALPGTHALDRIQEGAARVHEHQVAVLSHHLQHEARLRLAEAESEVQDAVEADLPGACKEGTLQVLAQEHREGRRRGDRASGR